MFPSPRVSVIMAVHNGATYLHEAVDSILGQTLTDFEFIVVDDASNDETPQILAKYAETDQRVVLLRNETNLGPYPSANRALEIARAPLIARMDADDISEPERLATQVSFLDSHPDHLLVASSYRAIDERGRTSYVKKKPASHNQICWWMRFRMPIEHPSVMFRAKFREGSAVRYDTTYPVAQDFELFVRLSLAGKLAILPEVLLRYRVHSANLTSTRRHEQKQNVLRIATSVQQRELPQAIRDDLRAMMECYQLQAPAHTLGVRLAVRAFRRMIADDIRKRVASERWLNRHSAEILADSFLRRGRGFSNPVFVFSFLIHGNRFLLPLAMRVLENYGLLPTWLEAFPSDVAA